MAYFFLSLLLDASPQPPRPIERSWRSGEWVFVTNDPFLTKEDSGSVVALQISGRGESCAIRRRLFPLKKNTCVALRIRWTEAPFGHAYPSVHLFFDPPPLTHAWWRNPMEGNQWSGTAPVFLFHFATDPGWRQYGMSRKIESSDWRHHYSSAKNEWIDLRFTISSRAIDVSADGKEVAQFHTPLSGYRTFAIGIGDQTSTRVELDELRVFSLR